jgi:hypothetical protein
MVEAAKGARSDDTGGLKMKAALYIPLKAKLDTCIPPITNEKSKSDRGFNHPMISRLLCPQKLLDRYDKDPEYVSECSIVYYKMTCVRQGFPIKCSGWHD